LGLQAKGEPVLDDVYRHADLATLATWVCRIDLAVPETA